MAGEGAGEPPWRERLAGLRGWETHLERGVAQRWPGTGAERRRVVHGDLPGDDVLDGTGERGMSATTTSRPTWRAGAEPECCPTIRR